RRPVKMVVVVGIAHLIGQDGVPARLRRDGLSVQGP
ncbi:MAG: TraB/GumN family protein, partial [Caulobacteraceae bacterium]|nr:TraB/GumN family protein [Caulobacteraceae bacterium]